MTNIQSGYLKTKNGVQLMTTVPYPIGAIYLSIDSTNPTKLFGGTQQQIAQGRTLVGVDTSDIDFNIVEKTGGEKTHTLTVDEMPSHTHGSKSLSGYFNIRSCGAKKIDYSITNVDGIITRNRITWSGTHLKLDASSFNSPYYEKITVDATHEHTSVGENQTHNNLQPYYTCYIWLRIA